MQTPNTRTINRSVVALRRWFLMIFACLAPLPLPVPVIHRHDSIEAPELLAGHLEQRHSAADFPKDEESHWHFVFRSQCEGEHGSHGGVPLAETEFVALSNGSACSMFMIEEVSSKTLPGDLLAVTDTWTLRERSPVHERFRPAADALQAQRCQFGCVMRC